ncbi:hypothetical protein [Paraburkholderia terrae]
MQNVRSLALLLVATMVLCLTGCDKAAHLTPQEKAVVNELTEKLGTHCVGRYLIDMPDDVLTFGRIEIQGVSIETIYPKLGPLPLQPQHGPVKFNMRLADMPGPNGTAHANTAWRIVQASDAEEALMSSESILSGKSDADGKVTLAEAEQKLLHEAYNEAPGRTWLVSAGLTRQLALEREQEDWAENPSCVSWLSPDYRHMTLP